MKPFGLYAAYYNLLYRDKDYAGEVAYVRELLGAHAPGARSILEVGCGTGGHALHLVEGGFSVHGIDISPAMIELANERARTHSFLQERARFELGDARNFRSSRRYDAVVSLFHVMSYQVTNVDLTSAFATAGAHLEAGGVFVFDFWYGPAVLTDPPRHVSKEVEDDEILVRRRTTPTLLSAENYVNVHFDVEITSKRHGRREVVAEDHRMRYLFLPEIKDQLERAGMEFLTACAWLSRSPLSERTWYGCVVARKS
jgi:SAM-dependent methyltransferase